MSTQPRQVGQQSFAATHRPRLALALSGGAARGLAHIGVLKVFEEAGITVDFIAGTSAGAVVGGAYAAGLSPIQLEEMARSVRWRDIGRMTLNRGGLQSNYRMEEMLRARLPVTRFEDLRIPFAAVATDLHTGAPVVMRDAGDLTFAIRASCALPALYVPVVDEQGRQLVDGGLVANVPVQAARELCADALIVAVDVNAEGAKFLGAAQSMLGVLVQAIMVVQRNVAAHQIGLADVALLPHVGHIRWDEMRRADDLIAAGEESARAALPLIKEKLAAERTRSKV